MKYNLMYAYYIAGNSKFTDGQRQKKVAGDIW